jgi:hypothetical protein
MHGDDPDGVAELRSALVAADRATFGPAHEQEAASRELVDATEAWLRR